ncbi:MAG: HD domain-containing protein [Clostridiales bacterium]|nr:HD domain-containing protein [Clostridiales bacterium]
MLYTPMTKKAMQLAYDAHKEQRDKNGLPYIYHPFHLAEQMDTEQSICAALLHDVVEDSETTLEDLRAAGFTAEVVEAVELLTRQPDVPYLTYIERLRQSPLAVKVKLADLRHNADLSRMDIIDSAAREQEELHRQAIDILTRK